MFDIHGIIILVMKLGFCAATKRHFLYPAHTLTHTHMKTHTYTNTPTCSLMPTDTHTRPQTHENITKRKKSIIIVLLPSTSNPENFPKRQIMI